MLKEMKKLSVSRGLLVRQFAAVLVLLSLIIGVSGTASAVTSWYADGKHHTVVLMQDGTVWVAGEDNSQGQFGNGKFSEEGSEPVQVPGLADIKAVAAGNLHSVALKKDGTVWTWGGNSSGQLGNGTMENSNIALQVAGLKGITSIAAGGSHTVALKRDGTVWTWGDNRLGQLGSGTVYNSSAPVMVGTLADVKSISAGGFHTIALKQDGTVWTWGYNAYGELGSDAVSSKGSSVPVKVSELSNVKAVSSGTHHCVALKKDNSVWVWGSNFYSQLGNGTTKNGSPTPVMVSGVSGVMGIIGKANHTMALMPDNTVLAWGDNGSGRWGNGIAMNGSAVPVLMSGYNELTTIAAVADPRTLSRQERSVLAGGDIAGDHNETVASELGSSAGQSGGDGRGLVLLATASAPEMF